MRAVVDVARKLAVAGVVTVGAELALAVLWPAPEQPEFDASGSFGSSRREPLRLAALGDSTLTAPGVVGRDEIWVSVVADRLSTHLDRGVDLLSLGAGGATAAAVMRDQLPAALEFSPHVSLLSVGANDVMRGVPMRRFMGELDMIVGELSRQGSAVVMSGVGDLGAIPRLAPPLRQMASRLGRRADRIHAEVARRHGAVKADQWSWAASQFRTRHDVWSLDRFHPNAAGHQIWAEVCWAALSPMVGTVTVR
jgi:lysophospholipase L1-like esterase